MKRTPLKRRAYLRRKRKPPAEGHSAAVERRERVKASTTKAKRSTARRKAAKRRERQFGPHGFVEFVHNSPCACGCGRGPCEVSHDPSRGAGGTWKDAHPLTTECHRELHAVGSKTFWSSRGTTREAVNLETQKRWAIAQTLALGETAL